MQLRFFVGFFPSKLRNCNCGGQRFSNVNFRAPDSQRDRLSESRSVLSNSLWPHRLYNPWNSPGLNTGVGSRSFLQGIFPTRGSDPGLPHCRWILYQLSHQGSPGILEWVAYPFFSGSSWSRNLLHCRWILYQGSSRKTVWSCPRGYPQHSLIASMEMEILQFRGGWVEGWRMQMRMRRGMWYHYALQM